MEDKTSFSNPWVTLPTITTFDRGSNAKTTVCLDNNRSNEHVTIVGPSTSLLIQSLIQQLCTVCESDTNCRNKLYFAICDKLHDLKLIDDSYNMVEFEALRSQYQRALYHLVTVARTATGCETALQIPSTLMTELSQYHREFQEIGFIAAGGFGSVFKALHRLDGIEYAVKKIIVCSGRIKSIRQHLEEVKTLAKLNHTNIVSYKSAWIESTLPLTSVLSLPSTSYSENKSNSLDYKRKNRYKSCINQSCNKQTQSSSNSSWSNQSLKQNEEQDTLLMNRREYKTGQHIDKENITNKNINELYSDIVSFRSAGKYQSNETENNSNFFENSDSCEESNNSKIVLPYVSQMNEQFATLYIQMALCDITLQQWLDERMEVTSQTVIMAILTQILCGLDYIHSHGIVHHDVKPSNIFISTSGRLQIQLGDFGLACLLQRENHHSVLGTHMYAAPEQLQGKCDPKSDIYSVGIVLLELLVHTKTNMERIEIINGIKRGQIPTTLTATYPKWVHIVSQLVQKDPMKRPTTSQLLQNLSEDKDMTIAQLRNDILEKENAIQELQKKISALETQLIKCNTSLEYV